MKREEALKILKDFHDNSALFSVRTALDTIIPELKESEDEKTRKELIEHIKANKEADYVLFKRVSPDDVIAWLEKQGKQKPAWSEEDEKLLNSALWHVKNSCGNGGKNSGEFEVYNWLKSLKDRVRLQPKQGEQKTNDNVEPKFNVGDWIINSKGTIAHINDVKTDIYGTLRYYIEFSNGTKSDPMPCFVDNEYRLWTIQDAKDGDVLASDNGCPFIYRESDNLLAQFYCCVNINNVFSINDGLNYCGLKESAKPATKEQRNLLFQKMKKARCEWDAEKKELTKIE